MEDLATLFQSSVTLETAKKSLGSETFVKLREAARNTPALQNALLLKEDLSDNKRRKEDNQELGFVAPLKRMSTRLTKAAFAEERSRLIASKPFLQIMTEMLISLTLTATYLFVRT